MVKMLIGGLLLCLSFVECQGALIPHPLSLCSNYNDPYCKSNASQFKCEDSNFKDKCCDACVTFLPVYNCDVKNPCGYTLLTPGKYYYPNIDPTKYVQCSKWGRCRVRSCARSFVWNEKLLTCRIDKPERDPSCKNKWDSFCKKDSNKWTCRDATRAVDCCASCRPLIIFPREPHCTTGNVSDDCYKFKNYPCDKSLRQNCCEMCPS